MNEIIYNVSQVSEYIKQIFEAEEMLIGIKVLGEITNFKQSGRAVYFDLKDENASLPCVIFDSSIAEGFNFGDKVVVKGKPNYYTKGGRLSFVVSKIEKAGVGELFEEYQKLKTKLERDGIFDPLIKKPLPKYPKRIGVVTSRTGAVIRDIIRVARSKNLSADIVLFPAKVQGVGAKEEIIKGIKVLDEMNLDLIIVARGGGSFEDYQPFNSEEVVMAVYNAKTPLISAIGHENDYSLIDFAADARAGTPSIASDMAFNSEKEYLEKMNLLINSAIKTIENNYLTMKNKLSSEMGMIERIVLGKIDKFKDRTDRAKNLLAPLTENKLDKFKAKIDILSQAIEKSNPMSLLTKGYTRIKAAEGKTICNINDIRVGDEVSFKLVGGHAVATINDIKEKKNG